MGRYAVIDEKTKEVLNCIEWDGKAKWSPPKGTYVIESQEANRGDIHNGKNFIPSKKE